MSSTPTRRSFLKTMVLVTTALMAPMSLVRAYARELIATPVFEPIRLKLGLNHNALVFRIGCMGGASNRVIAPSPLAFMESLAKHNASVYGGTMSVEMWSEHRENLLEPKRWKLHPSDIPAGNFNRAIPAMWMRGPNKGHRFELSSKDTIFEGGYAGTWEYALPIKPRSEIILSKSIHELCVDFLESDAINLERLIRIDAEKPFSMAASLRSKEWISTQRALSGHILRPPPLSEFEICSKMSQNVAKLPQNAVILPNPKV